MREEADVLTADGRVIQIRPVRGDDAGALRRLYESADAAAMWRRLKAAPLLTGYRGKSTVDLKLRLANVGEEPDATQRTLRS